MEFVKESIKDNNFELISAMINLHDDGNTNVLSDGRGGDIWREWTKPSL